MTLRKHAVGEVRIIPIAVRGEIRAGESLSARLLEAARSRRVRFQDGDILVVKHKIVSKAEGAVVPLDEVRPSAASRIWEPQRAQNRQSADHRYPDSIRSRKKPEQARLAGDYRI